MALIGTGIKIAKGFARKEYLSSAIEQNKKVKELPVLDFYTSLLRLNNAIELCDAITDNYFTGLGHSYPIIELSLQGLLKEFVVNQDSLENEVATKAQVYSLGLAIRELSIGLEMEKKLIETILDAKTKRFDELAIKNKKDIENSTANAISEMQRKNHEHIEQLRNENKRLLKIVSTSFFIILMMMFFYLK